MPRSRKTRKKEPSLRKSLAIRRLMERVNSAIQDDFQETRDGVRSRFERLRASGMSPEEASKVAIEESAPSIDAWSALLTASGIEAGQDQAFQDYESSSALHKREIDAAMERGGLLSNYINSRQAVTRKIRSLSQRSTGGARRSRGRMLRRAAQPFRRKGRRRRR